MSNDSGKTSIDAVQSVAVVTRTRNRPALLARAARSVAGQSFRDLVWVVVNDGGDEAAVARVIEASGHEPSRVRLVSPQVGVGMEAAANAGVRAVDSRFIVIHDDDDTWHPEFLSRTTDFLTSDRGRHYGGAVTHSMYVSEEMRGDTAVEHHRRPFNADLKSVHLAEMLVRNLFPPISFLFRREVWERASGFNERLPVLGDWYFNIRFLLAADIGVLPEALANWHHRDRGTDGAYANSVIGGRTLHEEYNAILRNALVRDLAGSPAALTPVLGYMMEQQRIETARLRRSLGSASASAVQITTGNTDPATQLAAVVDIADRRWVSMQLPPWLRLRLLGAADPAWPDLMPLLKSARIRPPSDFDEEAYRASNLDVARGLEAGTFTSGYEHYVRYGRLEGRGRPLKLPLG